MSKKDDTSFVVRITQNENSTWQGQITWVDSGETKNFRSALEMLKLMDGAIKSEDTSDDN